MRAKTKKKKRDVEDARLQKLLAKYRKPGAMEAIEAPAQARLQEAAREHAEILRRSREVAHTRVFR